MSYGKFTDNVKKFGARLVIVTSSDKMREWPVLSFLWHRKYEKEGDMRTISGALHYVSENSYLVVAGLIQLPEISLVMT